jgi:hypothetical protein
MKSSEEYYQQMNANQSKNNTKESLNYNFILFLN